MKIIYKFCIVFCSFLFIIILFGTLNAFDDGITGLTKKNGVTEGCSCHGLNPYQEVSVIIIAPLVVAPNDTVNCQLKISGGPLIAGGCDIAAGSGNIITSQSDTSLQRLLTSPGIYELTHRYPKFPSGDTVTFYFKYIAPNTPGINDTIFANGNSVNHDTTPSGDKWNYAGNKIIQISNSIGIVNNNKSINDFRLYQNYPNPFNPSTNIRFDLHKSGFVVLKVYNITGKEIATLENGKLKSGTYGKQFSNNQLPGGVYFYTLSVDGNIISAKKMVLVK